MADRMDKEQRHKCMSRIKSKDTKPELIVRRYLHAHGYRYRINVKRLPGTPRHSTAQVQDSHLHQRLLLARPRRLQAVCNAKEQHPILGKENRTQQTARHRKTHPTAPPRLAHNYHLGVRALTKEATHHPAGIGANTEQDIPAE